jgi:glycosyltransferase involved in cell wall biosynthesis
MDGSSYGLSVIVPVYNAESTLQSCVESILKQSYRNFELILVDDGSTDNSPVLCDEYAQQDSRVTVIHIKNSGTFQARKQGAKRAVGKILTFSDADDWLEENTFEAALQILCKYDPDILAYAYDCGGRVEKHLYGEGLYCKKEIKNIIIPGMMYDFSHGRRKLNPSLCCKLIKKQLFAKVTESVKDRVTLGEDALVTYPAVCMAESIFVCNKALYHYRVNSFSCTQTYPLERILEIKAFRDNMLRLFDGMDLLDQMRYQVENYVRSFLAVMVRKWYGMELSPILFSFPYRHVSKGAGVLIYGAGDVGKSYINELKLTRYAEIAGWADRNYGSIKEYNSVDVLAPETIKEKRFDVLLIAVWEEDTAKAIAADLLKLGIPEEKIMWKKPLRIV